MSKKRNYTVYFEQVNRIFIDVKAQSREDAERIATKLWKSDYAFPRIAHVDEPEQEDTNQ